MKDNLRLPATPPNNLTSDLSAHFQRTVEYHFRRLAQSAHLEWERRFGGQDPSDACVKVRIGEPPHLRSAA